MGKIFGLIIGLAAWLICGCKPSPVVQSLPEIAPGLAYTNLIVPKKPWSIFVARVTRGVDVQLHSLHASNSALGLTPLTAQIRGLNPEWGTPLVGVNGDFYQRERAFAGDPRGLQIMNGELISAPGGTASFWIDSDGKPEMAIVSSRFSAKVGDQSEIRIGLNEELYPTNAVLFTPAAGGSTKTSGGTELILERDGVNRWLPLAVCESFTARVREVRTGGNAPLAGDFMVLSIGARIASGLKLESGLRVTISTATEPLVRGARIALSGGPILARAGKGLKVDAAGIFDPKSYSARSMLEEHPRSAIGWNDSFFYFIEVDGRSKASVGMTLEQLRDFMLELGCANAVNLDGGGSSTMWFNGSVVNHPCDGFERPIANSLVATRKSESRSANAARK